MTDFVKVAKIEDIPSGERLKYEFEEETVIIFNKDGVFYCIADICSHDNGPLEDAELENHAIECPRHGACFDIRTGVALNLPATSPIPTFVVKIENGDVYVESPDDW